MQAGAGQPVVGREAERAELLVALANAGRGRGAAVIVLGEAGIGKSVLAGWLIDEATERGFRVGRGYCSRAGALPLWPWRGALDGLGLQLSGLEPGSAPSTSVPDSAERLLFAAAVVDGVVAAAWSQPILLVLEDLHWADPPSIQLADALAEAAPSAPLLIMFSWRDDPGETGSDVAALIAALPTGVRRIPLGPLTVDEVAELAESVLHRQLSEPAAEELHRRTGGSPFFVHEIARLTAAQGSAAPIVVPRGIQDVLRRRIARLGQRCAELLPVAAVAAGTAGEVIEVDVLVRATGRARPEVVQLLDEAAAARLFDDAGPRLRFRHALVREVLEQSLSPADRRVAHEQVAKALERAPAPEAARLAHHWLQAGGSDARARATFWSLAAAREAMAGFGFEAAASHYARALDDPDIDRIAVRIAYGEALHHSGDVAEARDVLVATARDAAAANRPVELARSALALGGGVAGFEVAQADEVQIDLLQRADDALPETEVALRAAVRGRLSIVLAGTVPVAERVRLAEDAVRLASACGDRSVESSVLAAYCDAVAGPDDVAPRLAAARRMLDLVRRPGAAGLSELTATLLAYRLIVVACLESGDPTDADQAATGYEASLRRAPSGRYSWLPPLWRGMRALLDGDPDLALQWAEEVEQIALRAGSFNGELMAFTVRAQAHLDRGTPAEFADETRSVLSRLPAAMPPMYLAGPARILLAAGDDSSARSVLRAFVGGSAATRPKDAEWLECHWAMADIALALGDREAAAGVADALRPYENLWAVDGIGGAVFGNVAEQIGRLDRFLGRPEAPAYLAAARERYRTHSTPALLARLDRETAGSSAPKPSVEGGHGRLRRDGQVWLIEWRGRRSLVPDAKGLRDLAVLLARPNEPIAAIDLVAVAGGPPAEAAGGDLGPVLDAQARRAYRARLSELEREIAEAEADADLGRLEQLRAERAMLVDELGAALGLGGRPRHAGDPAERARKAVTMRIRAAIGVIESQDPSLAQHLRNTIRTGRYCSYQPEDGLRWHT